MANHSGLTMRGLRERELGVVADPDAERTTRGSTGATGGDSGLRGSWADLAVPRGQPLLQLAALSASLCVASASVSSAGASVSVVCASVSFSHGSSEPGILCPHCWGKGWDRQSRALLRWSPLSSSAMGAAVGRGAGIPMVMSTAAWREISLRAAADF